ncbi:ribonuclease P protein component [Mycolicibacillus trivialis]|uniref:ribonuclease P protein component n=1 Tax=Mycolicibacillus trivialis TaxID=1798 RepID=UPI000A15F0E3|nr:ribonuclease P protein component [Mycolicibacillus trivialis]
MLPAQYRMRRSTEFADTIKRGTRSVQPDLVVHARRTGCPDGPRIGLVVSKSVGTAVDRHRVSRRLRHVARDLLGELDSADRIVIRARPSSREAVSESFNRQLQAGFKHALRRAGVPR